MRQEGVRVASGRRQDNLASGWRQDDVKRRGARIKYSCPPKTHPGHARDHRLATRGHAAPASRH